MRHIVSSAALLLIAATALACGSSVDPGGGSGGGGGSTSATTSTTSGGGGGGQECTDPPALGGSFRWSYVSPDGEASSCDGVGPGATVDEDGFVAEGSNGVDWLIDACSPENDCVPRVHTIHLESDVPIEPPPTGTFVHLSASLHMQSGPPPVNCALHLLVTNLPTWGTLTNPTAADSLPWFDPLENEGSLFAASYEQVCTIDHPDPGCSWTEAFYQVTVALAADPSTHTDPMLPTQTGHLMAPDGGGQGVDFTTRYVVSSNGNCENPGDSAVWVTRTPVF